MIFTINQGKSYESVSVIGTNSSCSDLQCARLCTLMPINAPSDTPPLPMWIFREKFLGSMFTSQPYVKEVVPMFILMLTYCQRGHNISIYRREKKISLDINKNLSYVAQNIFVKNTTFVYNVIYLMQCGLLGVWFFQFVNS